MSFHVLVPGAWTVQRGHRLLEKIEADVRQALPNAAVFTHLESLNDPASWDDTGLERAEPLSQEPMEPGASEPPRMKETTPKSSGAT